MGSVFGDVCHTLRAPGKPPEVAREIAIITVTLKRVRTVIIPILLIKKLGLKNMKLFV